MQDIYLKSTPQVKLFALVGIFLLSLSSVYLILELWNDIRIFLVILPLLGIKVCLSYLIAEIRITKNQIMYNRSTGKKKIATSEIKQILLMTIKPNDAPLNFKVIRFILNNGSEIVYPARIGRSKTIKSIDVEAITGVSTSEQAPVTENSVLGNSLLGWEFWL